MSENEQQYNRAKSGFNADHLQERSLHHLKLGSLKIQRKLSVGKEDDNLKRKQILLLTGDADA